MRPSHVTKLDMDYVVASLLLKEMKRKSLETIISSSGFEALVSKESNDKTRDTRNNENDKGKVKQKCDIMCYYCDTVSHIIKHCRKLTEDKQNGKDQEQKGANMVNFDELIVILYCSHENYGANYGLS